MLPTLGSFPTGSRPHPLANTMVTTGLSAAAAVMFYIWRWADLRDPACMPQDPHTYGSAAAAAAYAGWPRAGAGAKTAYFAANLPLLVLHLGYHWSCPDPWQVAVAMALAAGLLAVRAARRAYALLGPPAFVAAVVSLEVARMAACEAPGSGVVACGASVRTRWAQCPPCSQMGLSIQMVELLLPWRLAVGALVFHTPLPVYAIAALGLCSLLAVAYARYGLDASAPASTPLALATSAQEVALADVARAALSRRLLELAASCVASRLLVPRLAGLALAPLQAAWRRAVRGRRASLAPAPASAPAQAPPKNAPSSPAPPPTGAAFGAAAPPVSAPAAEDAAAAAAVAPAAAAAAVPAAAFTATAATGSVDAVLCRMSAAVARAQAAHAAGASDPSLYRPYSSSTRRSVLVVKVALPEAQGAAGDALLATTLPEAVCRAVAQAGGGGAPPPAAQRPRVTSFVGFRGCYAVAAGVVNWEGGAGGVEAVEAALPALLPPDAQVLGVAEVTAGAAHGLWLDPVCLSAVSGAPLVTLQLPAALAGLLEGAGRGLRVVVSAPGQPTALVDMSVFPGDARWPAAGQLRVSVPCEDAAGGALRMLSVMSTPAPAPAGDGGDAPAAQQQQQQHGRDTPLAAVPLLAGLPEAAAEEVRRLWAAMVDHTARKLVGACAAEVLGAAHAEFSSFGHDLGVLLHPVVRSCKGEAAEMGAYLTACGMVECRRLVDEAAAAAAALGADIVEGGEEEASAPSGAAGTAAATAPPGAFPAPAAPPQERPSWGLRDVLVGFPSPSTEAAFQAWKARALVTNDGWALLTRALLDLVFVWRVVRFGSSAHVALFTLVKCAAGCLPGAVLVFARREHLRRRAAWRCVSVLAHAAVMALLPRLDGEAGVAMYQIHHPWGFAITQAIMYPFFQRLGVWQQAVACVGLSYEMHLVFVRAPGGSGHGPPRVAWVAMPALALTLAGMLEWRLRRQWRRRHQRDGCGTHDGVGAQAAASGGVGGGAAKAAGCSSKMD